MQRIFSYNLNNHLEQFFELEDNKLKYYYSCNNNIFKKINGNVKTIIEFNQKIYLNYMILDGETRIVHNSETTKRYCSSYIEKYETNNGFLKSYSIKNNIFK